MPAAVGESEEPVLERDHELGVIAGAVAGVGRGEGALVLIDGPAGVGKTTLMLGAIEASAEADLVLLRARGSELERPFGFGVIRQLFDPVVQGDPGSELLTGSARFAASVLDVGEGSPPQDPFATRNSIYWLTANLASRRPVLMLVDDAHWADDSSLEVLTHLANRLHGIPVALMLAARSEASGAPLELLRRTVAELGSLLHPAALGEEAAIALIRSFAPEAGEALARACFDASGGNPFLLRELARSVASGGPGDPEAVLDQSPQRVTRDIASRLARLPASATELAHAAAVLGDGTPLRRGSALAGLYEDDVTEAADALVAGGILRSAAPLEFLHPLVRAGVYAGMGPASRSIEHWRAAKMLASEGEGPERVASQLLLCEPGGERWSVEQLQRAAALAMGRGSPATAVTLLRRALAEPPPAEARSRVLFDLGTAEAMALDLEPSVEHMREACVEGLDAENRFQGAMLLAAMLGHAYRFAEAVDVLEEQLTALAGHPELVRQVEVALTNITRVDPETRLRTERLRAEIARRVDAGEDDDPATIGTRATELAMAGEPVERTIELAARAVAMIDPGVSSSAAGWSGFNSARVLVLSEAFDQALEVLDRAIEKAEANGAWLDYGGVLIFRSELYVRRGDLVDAEIDARALLELARETGWAGAKGMGIAFLGQVLVDRGELEEAEEWLTARDASRDGILSTGYSATEVRLARARLLQAMGRLDEAVDELREAGAWAEAVGNVNPSAVSWRSQLAECLAELGARGEAKRLAGEEVELARRHGSPRATSIALRALAQAEGGEEEIRLLREAEELMEASPALLETARVQFRLGAALRRERQRPDAAREHLRRAVDLAHRCGATVLEDEALEELRATGARPRRRLTTGLGALTPSERRIAELAASGQQNREIAETLFVTTNTVEFHLRNAYRKLGIDGRGELPGVLQEPAGS